MTFGGKIFNDFRENQLTKFFNEQYKKTIVIDTMSCYVVHTAWRIWIMDRNHA